MADNPVLFAAGLTRLLTDVTLWQRLATAGFDAMHSRHGHAAAKRSLLEALTTTLAARRQGRRATARVRMTQRDYALSVRLSLDAIARATPPGATVAVVSRGDENLTGLPGRAGWHFPRGADGGYAGYHPASDDDAVAELENARLAGADYLAVPAPSFAATGMPALSIRRSPE